MTVLLAGGGTLGPVMPLLAVAEVLNRRGDGVVFVGTPDGPERALLTSRGIPFRSIPVVKLRRGWSPATLRLPLDAVRAVRAASRILRSDSPTAVLGAGGFTSVPVGFAAYRQGIPVVIHQQDVEPSLSNRLLARFASAVTVSLPMSQQFFPRVPVTVTGNPVRSEIAAGNRVRGLNRWGFTVDRPVTVVFGGGTGAVFLNRLVVDALDALRRRTQVLHVSGVGRGPVGPPAPGYVVVPRLDAAMADAYAAADALVCRAGFTTLSELMLLPTPALVVPMPGTHQEANADWFGRAGAIRVASQAELTARTFPRLVADLLASDRSSLRRRRASLSWPDAAERVADVVQGVARRG